MYVIEIIQVRLLNDRGVCNKVDRAFVNVNTPVNAGRKLNLHKTFRKCPGRLLNMFCTFKLRPASRE